LCHWQLAYTLVILGLITENLSMRTFILPDPGKMCLSYPRLVGPASHFTRAHSSEFELSYAVKYFLKHSSYRIECFWN